MSNINAAESQKIQNMTITSALNDTTCNSTAALSNITASTASNTLLWPPSSNYTSTFGGSYITTTSGNPWTTLGDAISYGYLKDTTMENLFLYLKEEEISEIFNKIIERESDSEKIKNIISRVVRVRHFSEEFLLEYISYMDISDITIMHNADIKSGEYPNIALMIEGLK